MALLLVLVVMGALSPALGASCMDEGGAPVDWWLLLKHPRWADKSHSQCIGNCDGDTYVYVTSASAAAAESSSSALSWSIGGAPVSSASDSLLGATLAGVYNGSVANYVFYNDQLPDGTFSETYGHSKGFFGWDEGSGDTAFWVQHSIPTSPLIFPGLGPTGP